MNGNWQKAKEIFAAGLEIDPAERGKFLDKACGGDVELRRDIESLLASDDAAKSFLQETAVSEVADFIAPPVRFESGRLFGQYEIVELIGSGGMGEVYLARDRRLDRQVAIKLIPASASPIIRRFEQEAQTLSLLDRQAAIKSIPASASSNVKRFEQEVRTLSSLNHPNILTIHDFGSEGNDHFMVSEFVDGVTLRDRLKDSSPSTNDSLDIALQILAALSTAHEAGIIHRDIKPENIMIRQDGLVKVLDFGVAKLAGVTNTWAGEAASTDLDPIRTNPGSLIGSIGYMSPEQASRTDIDARSDLFSFGIVLYEMIAGRAPFKGEGIAEMIESTRSRPIVPLRNVQPCVSPELEGVVHKCLVKDREKRFQTANEVIEAVRHVRSIRTSDSPGGHSFGRSGSLTGHFGSDTSETPAGDRPTLSIEPPKRSTLVNIALAAIFLILATGFDGLGYWITGSGKPAKPVVANEAYQSYLRGRFLWNKRTAGDMKSAIAEFERALQIEPDYALAHAGLADCYTLLEQYTGAPASETLPRAKEYALRAVELDGSSSEAHTSLGYVYYALWQWSDAERHLSRAVRLGLNNPTAHHRYYLLLRETGQLDKAAEIITRARDLDPLSLVINLSYARSFLIRGDADTCVGLTQKLIRLYPDYAPGHTTLGSALIRQNRYTEALAEMEKAVAIVRSGQTLSSLGFAKALAGDTAGAERLISEMHGMYERRQVLGREIGLIYVGLARHDEAFRWLETDFNNRSTELPSIVSMRDFDRLRGDPRFADLVRRIGLPQ